MSVEPGDIVLFHTGTWNRFAGFALKLLGAHGGPTRAVALVG